MRLSEIIEMDKKYFMNTFGDRVPVCFEYGKGINLWDNNGNKYYDFLAGIAVNALGHSHPSLVNALKKQLDKYIHCSSLYYIEQQARLAKVLVENSCADRVFFSNSGAEANEGAIKLVRMYFRKKGMTDKYEIITLKKSFHGRTITTIAATGQQKYQKPCSPLTPGFKMVTKNDIDVIGNALTDRTCAIMVEPIQGEGGVNPMDKDYMKKLRKLCDEKGIVLILDEVQCGLGRTGKLFGYEHFDIEPDIFTLAKALGGGFPVGALCAKGELANTFGPGDHGSTFGGNPLACSAALAVIETVISENLVDNAAQTGQYFISELYELCNNCDRIIEIRGSGLMIGIQLAGGEAVQIRDKCFEKGYLIGNIGDSILRVLPPLILSKSDVDGFMEMFKQVMDEINS